MDYIAMGYNGFEWCFRFGMERRKQTLPGMQTPKRDDSLIAGCGFLSG
jgi:hypothetical protein